MADQMVVTLLGEPAAVMNQVTTAAREFVRLWRDDLHRERVAGVGSVESRGRVHHAYPGRSARVAGLDLLHRVAQVAAVTGRSRRFGSAV